MLISSELIKAELIKKMTSSSLLLILLALILYCTILLQARPVLELGSSNFELTITAYKYLAVLFYDQSEQSKLLEEQWLKAAKLIGDSLPADCELAKVSLPV